MADKKNIDCTTIVLKTKLCHGNESRLSWAKHFPYSYYKCRASDISAVGTTFNVFCYEAVWADNQIFNLPNTELMRYVLLSSREYMG